MEYSSKSYKELKVVAADRGLATNGKKVDIIARLEEQDDKLSKFSVYVKTLSGSIYTIYLEPTDTILKLKTKLYEERGFPVNKQRLYRLCMETSEMGDIQYQDGTVAKQVSDDKTLLDYGINKGSFFYLQMKLI